MIIFYILVDKSDNIKKLVDSKNAIKNVCTKET